MESVSPAGGFPQQRGCLEGAMKPSAFVIVWLTGSLEAEDVMEFLHGNQLPGTMVAIHKPEREVEVCGVRPLPDTLPRDQ